MKSLLTVGLVLFSFTSFADIEVKAKKVVGESKFQNISAIKQCSFIVASNPDRNSVSVGLNSEDAMSANMLIEIPINELPLIDGSSLSDRRGNKGIYENGVLFVERTKQDDTFGGKEIKIMKLIVSSDLKNVKSGSVKLIYKRLLFSEVQTEMSCNF